MCFLRQPRLLPGFLEFLVKFPDRPVELVDLPDLARQFRFETDDASREEFVSNVVEKKLAHPCLSFVSPYAATTV